MVDTPSVHRPATRDHFVGVTKMVGGIHPDGNRLVDVNQTIAGFNASRRGERRITAMVPS